MRPHSLVRLLTIATLLCAPLAAFGQSDIPAGARFVMSNFKGDGGGGDERLYISTSPDGLTWTALNSGNPVWQPASWSPFYNVVRDPAIIYDRGWFWVAYTSGNYGRHASFGLVKSTDLLNWTFVGEISTSLPGATDSFTWNPSFFRDGDGTVHIFVSISPINGSQFNPIPALRSYELHPVSADWTNWSAPAMVSLPSANENELWVWKEGGVYHAVYVDFRSNSAWIEASSTNLLTGWTYVQYLGYNTLEGGQMLKKPDGSGYRFYIEGGNSGQTLTYVTADCDTAFTHFTPLQSVTSSIPLRNGKMTALPAQTNYSAWVAQALDGYPPAAQATGADPDGDGLANALDYAFGLDPLTPTSSLAPQLGISTNAGGPWLTLTFREMPSLADAAYTVESSADLVHWNSGTAAIAIDSRTLLTDGAEQVVARSLAPIGATSYGFLRVSVDLASQTPSALRVNATGAKTRFPKSRNRRPR